MKTILATFIMLTVMTSFAGNSIDDLGKTNKWIESQMQEMPIKDISGVTLDGKDCTVSFSNLNLSSGGIYITVHVNDELVNNLDSLNNVIGVNTSRSNISTSTLTYRFSSSESWGNKSNRNSLVIETDANGKPVSVKGSSDLKEIKCRVDGALPEHYYEDSFNTNSTQ